MDSIRQTAGSVLVVDDDPRLLDLICSMLEEAGLHCDTQRSGAAALAAVDGEVERQGTTGWSPWDVLILDVNLSDLDGFRLLEAIRERPGFETVPVLFMSGARLDQEDIERGLALGALDYVAKPFRTAILQAKVQNFAELGRFRREAHQTALALEESEAWHGKLFEGSSQGILVLDDAFRIIRCNQAAAALLHSEPDVLKGKELSAMIAKSDQVAEGDVIKTLRRTARPRRSVCSWLRADRSRFEAELHVDYLSLMGRPCYVVFFDNVTERVETERRIAELAEFRANLIENANVWIDTTDPEGRVITWNRAAEQFSGYRPVDVIGEARVWAWLYPDPQYREQVRLQIREALDAETVQDFETTIVRRDGGRRTIAWTVSPLLGSQGTSIGLISIGQDVTNQRQMEGELRRYTERLEEILAERTQRIHKLEHDRAEAEKFVAQGQVAAGIAHEINNPLATIQNFMAILSEGEVEASEHARYLRIIGKEVKRIAGIVSQMYDLYQPGAQEATLVSVNYVIGELLQTLESRLRRKRIVIVDHRTPAPARVVAPPGHLTQILFNVIRNALDAIEKEGQIEILTRPNEDRLIIEIADTGSGILPDDLPHIFEPFFTTRRGRGRDSGLGLGLAVTRSLVKALHGEIGVVSTSSQGTRMRIALPSA